MPPVAGLLMGAFAAFIAWTLVRALRDGVIFSDGIGYDIHEQPTKFASTVLLHGTGALLFAWLAAHNHIAVLYSLVLPH
jgi:hypothetical protein